MIEGSTTYSFLSNARYRRIIQFFAGLLLHIILWDLFVSRLPLWGARIRGNRPQRLRLWSRRFRLLAVDMGGVMIKLGQFLSGRVDVLPPEITGELAGLQDEVPPVETDVIFAVLRRELGDLSQVFAEIEQQPVAAASLGQAHRARLAGAEGDSEAGHRVVVKVQRPGIEELVQTDLSALGVVVRWIMRYPPLRRRADAPALLDEFAETLWQELDYEAEAGNAERLAAIHRDDDCIYIPAVHRAYSSRTVIVLEDVEAIKIADLEALAEAGVDPKAVADCLLGAYFNEVFREGFFHADPHPGNLFVQPRPDVTWEPELGPRPFWLVFVDFGMVGRVPQLMGQNLRRVLISVTQRDARGLTNAFEDLGFFLPGADLDRIAEALGVVLNRIWGRSLQDLARPDPREMQEIGREFLDLLFDFPFQVPQDFIYLGRATGLISGLVSQLDPEIDPWQQLEKYGRALLQDQRWPEFSRETLFELLRPLLETPPRVQRLLAQAESGDLEVRTRADPDTIRRLDRLERRVGRLSWSILAAAGMLSATLLYIFGRRRD